jgi:tetratricopeptide (TPR) repeat protein
MNFMKPGEIAESRYLEGQTSFRKKEFENAVHSFASAIYFDNSAAKYHYFYGCALGEIGKYKDALEALKKALELKPSDLDTLAEIGHIYLKLGFPLRAKGHFKKVLEKSPSHTRATEGMRLIK